MGRQESSVVAEINTNGFAIRLERYGVYLNDDQKKFLEELFFNTHAQGANYGMEIEDQRQARRYKAEVSSVAATK